MKQVVITALALLAGLFVLPLILIRGEPLADAGELLEQTQATLPPRPQPAGTSIDAARTVTVQTEEGIVTLALDDYLWRVTAAEMPASFEPAALQAQAVAARTYTLYKQSKTVANHPDADVCTDIQCCKAYITPEEAAANWGENSEAYTQKIADAVSSTDGVAIFYDGVPIQAVFHSSSAGRTKDAAEVWGSSVPYLAAVETPEGEGVPNYYSQVTVSAEDFRGAVLDAYPEAALEGSPTGWFGQQTYSDSGALETVTVGGVAIRATVLRSLFSLRSATFAITPSESGVTFFVTGYGHGVGMSQYGANELAKEGKSYEEILKWYYTGVTLQTIDPA